MNIEMFFIQTDAFPKLSELISHRLKSPPDPLGQQPNWGIPSSYDALLAAERKRKIILSLPADGWVAGVESKGVVDFALLQLLAETLTTKVIAIQLYEVSGFCGYAMNVCGAVTECHSSEEDDDPSGNITRFLELNGIKHRLVSFQKAIQMRNQGWRTI